MIHTLTSLDCVMDIAQLSAADFEPLVNEAFSLELEEGAGSMTLIEVETRASAGTVARAPFSLLFRSEDIGALPQQVCRLHHGSLGTVEIFLVPVQEQDGKTLYEAVFN